MAQQTAVEWLEQKIANKNPFVFMYIEELGVFEQAKKMEIERIIKDFKIAYNQGYLDAQCNHINDADNLAEERDYLQSQINDIDAQIKDKENKIADILINNFPEDKNK